MKKRARLVEHVFHFDKLGWVKKEKQQKDISLWQSVACGRCASPCFRSERRSGSMLDCHPPQFLSVWPAHQRAGWTGQVSHLQTHSNITSCCIVFISCFMLFLVWCFFFFFNSPFRGRDVSCETPRVMPHCTSRWSLRWFHHRLVGIVGTLCGWQDLSTLAKGRTKWLSRS